MIALVVSLVLMVIVGLIGYYTNIISVNESKFLIVSSVLYIILFGIIKTRLTTGKGASTALMIDSLYYPLIFYMLWFFTSASIGKLLTGRNNYQGFFEAQNRFMSTRNTMSI
jgi:hypothetical protein